MTSADPDARPYPHPKPNLPWLARRVEDALEPGLPIVDAHHHLWTRTGESYLLADFLEDAQASGHNLVGSTFVQCGYAYDQADAPEMRPVGETRGIVALVHAEQARRRGTVPACQAIVGFADLRLGDQVESVLTAHVDAGEGRFKGIRHSAASDPAVVSTMVSGTPPPGMMADAVFRRGYAVLGRMGLSYDAWIYHPQLPELEDLARAFPDVPIALNHLGGYIGVGRHARDKDATFAVWRASLARLAMCDNITVKLGGLARPVVGFDFHTSPEPWSSTAMADAWRPYIDTCIELFGPARCMFESNFPVDKGLTSYGLLWNAFKRLAHGCSEADKRALFAGTAARFYRMRDVA